MEASVHHKVYTVFGFENDDVHYLKPINKSILNLANKVPHHNL